MTETLDRGRRLARRRMAWLSFGFLLTTGILVVGNLVLRDDPTAFASAIQTASGPLTGLLTVFTTVIIGYLGVSVVERTSTKDVR